MVVGGDSDDKIEDKGNVISLHDSVPVPRCLQSICDFPDYVHAAISGVMKDGLPIVCGGRKRSPYAYYNTCYRFNYTNAWEPMGSTSFALSHAGEFATFLFIPESKLFIIFNHVQS